MFCGVVERTGFLHSSSMTLYCALENTHDHVQSNQRKDVNGAIYSWAYRLGPVSPELGGSTSSRVPSDVIFEINGKLEGSLPPVAKHRGPR